MDHYIINIINHNKDKMEKHNYFEPAITYPDITHEEIRGLHRTFPFYIKFPKEYWPEIERAEKFTDEGELVFRELTKKYKDKYFDPVKTEPRFLQLG